MVTKLKGYEFDPGFGPQVLAFQGTVNYLYMDINRFKNLSQRKFKFSQYYKKILNVFNNNVGFYIGCLMWASYLKTLDEGEILSNYCYGKEYNEEENISDTQYMLNFADLFPKDMKYFMGQDYKFDEKITKLIQVYEEFLVLNKGFVNTKTNKDLVIPDKIKDGNAQDYKEIIDRIIKEKDLSKFIDYVDEII